jgi:hypothetical protein
VVKPVFQDPTQQVFQRPNLQYINYELLLKAKKELDIAVWSSQDRETTEIQLKHLFGRFLTQLLFVSFDPSGRTDLDVRPKAMSRNLSSVFQRYPHYDETNTIVVSNFYNTLEDFQRNDLILPEYHPRVGKTDFADDKHMFYLYKYIRFLLSLDKAIGTDIRHKLEAYSYDTFIQKLTKSVRYDSYAYTRSGDAEF